MTPWEYLRIQKERNPLRYQSHRILYILLGFLIVVFTFMSFSMISNNMNNRETYYFGVRPTLIITGSMEPTIMTNSIVIVEEVSFDEVNEGDIIRYNSDSGISVVHRVIHKADNYFITQGDNNKYPDDELVYYPKLNGRITEIHNEVAPIVTSIFGKFDPTDIGRGVVRMLLGFIKLAVATSMVILAIILIYDITAVNNFWLYKSDKMQQSLNWMNQSRLSKEDFNDEVQSYQAIMKTLKWHPLKKLRLRLSFRHYYSGLTEEQKKAEETAHRSKSFRRLLSKYGHTTESNQTPGGEAEHPEGE